MCASPSLDVSDRNPQLKLIWITPPFWPGLRSFHRSYCGAHCPAPGTRSGRYHRALLARAHPKTSCPPRAKCRHHAQAIHLHHNALPTSAGRCGGPRPLIPGRPKNRPTRSCLTTSASCTVPQRIVIAQKADAVLNHVPAFHTHQCGDFAVPVRIFYIGRGQRQLKRPG